MPLEIGSFVFWPNKDSDIYQFGRLLFKGARTSTVFIDARFGGKIVNVPNEALNLLNDSTIRIFGTEEKIAWVKSRIEEMRQKQPKEIKQPLDAEEFSVLTQKIFEKLREIRETENMNWSTNVLIKTAKHLAHQEKNQLFMKQLNKE